MKKRFGGSTLALALGTLLTMAGVANAQALVYTAVLSGPAENPANASPGTGFATVTYDPVAHTLRIQGTFSGLTGTTSLAHIHAPNATQLPVNDTPTPPGPLFGVATPQPAFGGPTPFPLGVTAASHDSLYDLTQASSFNAPFVTANGGTPATAEAQLALGLSQGRAYYNIHTSTFGGGEIRGFLQLVPEPSTFVIAGLGLVGLVAAHRRRK